jgi:hypothetical protein
MKWQIMRMFYPDIQTQEDLTEWYEYLFTRAAMVTNTTESRVAIAIGGRRNWSGPVVRAVVDDIAREARWAIIRGRKWHQQCTDAIEIRRKNATLIDAYKELRKELRRKD